MARKKKPEEAPAGAPLWMVTYSDMVTLLFAFFVLMFAFAEVDAAQFEEMAAAMRGALLGGTPRTIVTPASGAGDGMTTMLSNGITQMPLATVIAREQADEARDRRAAEFSQMAADFRTYFADRNLQEAVQVHEGENYILLRFADGILFDSGRADLRPEAFEALDAIANQLYGMANVEVMVEGHTDNIPISTARFRDNMDLSQARSAEVWRYFVNVRGMDPGMVSAIGFSEFSPIADNATPEGRQLNRRVEIRITRVTEHGFYRDLHVIR